jgi:F-type H+-transporting ATPase subunit alpha
MIEDFSYYLKEVGEIGYIEEARHSIVYVSGLPEAKPNEVVLFETGEMGQVMSLSPDQTEILLLSESKVKVGTKVARTDKLLEISVGNHLLGNILDPLGRPKEAVRFKGQPLQLRPIDITPGGLAARASVNKPLETGVTLIDLVIPLGKGQRELVVGDRKTGKTLFLLQMALAQTTLGSICIYAAIGKRRFDIKKVKEFFREKGIERNTIVIASSSSEPAGLIFLTPYTAMTVAEFFRDQGRDVLLLLDDMTTHAKHYREISLLAGRFPGRSSYPGDIFYAHARLMERAGNFVLMSKNDKGKLERREAAITCLPVAESVLGDLSGYIQTNLMSMTDGHIFFDSDYYNQGRLPAVNPFLSVTRVGSQTQSKLLKDLSRQLRRFLIHHQRMKEFLHFGAELSENVKKTLDLGNRVITFFNQLPDTAIAVNASVAILGGLWAGFWRDESMVDMKKEMNEIAMAYRRDTDFRVQIDTLIKETQNFSDLVKKIKDSGELFLKGEKESKPRV